MGPTLTRTPMQRLPFALLLIALSVAPLSAQRTRGATPAADLDPYIARVLRTFDVPGMAVTIVKDGKVLLARGYGVRRLGDTARVDADTRFGIGDNTKAFTATALAMLADEGTVPIDTPIVKYLPQFALADPYATANITARDLLVHRSGLGLGAGGLLWWPETTYDRQEVVRRLRYLPLKSGFRNGFTPDNALYLAAGELIAAATEKSWEQFITDDLLRKLKMSNTTTRHADAAQRGNVAATHASVDGKATVVPPLTNNVTNPISGMNSTAADMARWMLTQLNNGTTPDSLRIWGGWAQHQLWTGVTPIPSSDEFGIQMLREMNAPRELIDIMPQFWSFALGMEVKDYRGTRIVTHAGYVRGYASEVTYVPSLRLGITVLTNQERSEAHQAVTRRVLDEQLGVGSTDWVSILDNHYRAMLASLSRYRREMTDTKESLDSALRDTTLRSSLPHWKYAGTYDDPWYGTVTLEYTPGETLVLKMDATPGMIADVTHFERDVFSVRWRDRTLKADAYLWFQLDRDGDIELARMEAQSYDVHRLFNFQDLRLRPARPGLRRRP